MGHGDSTSYFTNNSFGFCLDLEIKFFCLSDDINHSILIAYSNSTLLKIAYLIVPTQEIYIKE